MILKPSNLNDSERKSQHILIRFFRRVRRSCITYEFIPLKYQLFTEENHCYDIRNLHLMLKKSGQHTKYPLTNIQIPLSVLFVIELRVGSFEYKANMIDVFYAQRMLKNYLQFAEQQSIDEYFKMIYIIDDMIDLYFNHHQLYCHLLTLCIGREYPELLILFNQPN